MKGRMIIEPDPDQPAEVKLKGCGFYCFNLPEPAPRPDHLTLGKRVVNTTKKTTGAVFECPCSQHWQSDGTFWRPITQRRVRRLLRKLGRQQ